jgi:hypothetical protein
VLGERGMILMVDFTARRKAKLDEIIKDLKTYALNTRYNPNIFPILEKLEKFRDEEL